MAGWLDERVGGAKAAWIGFRDGLRVLVALSLGLVILTLAEVLSKNTQVANGVFDTWQSTTASVYTALLHLPNLLTIAALGSMGAPLVVRIGDLLVVGPSATSYGYAQHVPFIAWLALAVPAASALRMGYSAARATGGEPRRAVAGALLSAVPFTLLCWLFAILAGAHVSFDFAGRSGGVSVGLAGFPSFILPVLWSTIGAWVGALVWLDRSRRGWRSSPRGQRGDRGQSQTPPPPPLPPDLHQ